MKKGNKENDNIENYLETFRFTKNYSNFKFYRLIQILISNDLNTYLELHLSYLEKYEIHIICRYQ